VAELRTQLREGKNAREEIVARNMGLVGHAVKLLKRSSGGRLDSGITEADIMQEGCIALLRAAEGFDFTMGVRFGTYATFWVRAAIKRAVQEQTRVVRLPSRVQNTYGKIMRATDSLAVSQGQPSPSETAVSEHLMESGIKLSPQRVRQIIAQVRTRPTSLDARLSRSPGTDGTATVGDLVRDERLLPADAEIVDESLRADLAGLMRKYLKEEEIRVLTLRFGLSDGAARTVRQVGEDLGLTYARTKHVLFSALSKMRQPHVALALRDYLPTDGSDG